MRRLALVVFGIAISVGPSLADGDCKSVLRLHGMLSRAKMQCRYSTYSQELREAAKACVATLGTPEAKAALKDGLLNFEFGNKMRGHDKMCADVLKDFPQYVTK